MSNNVGKVVQVIGTVVDVEFPGAGLNVPSLFLISHKYDVNEPSAVRTILDDPSSLTQFPFAWNSDVMSNLGALVKPE